MPKYYNGGENQTTIDHLLAGETVIVTGKGNSMNNPLITSMNQYRCGSLLC